MAARTRKTAPAVDAVVETTVTLSSPKHRALVLNNGEHSILFVDGVAVTSQAAVSALGQYLAKYGVEVPDTPAEAPAEPQEAPSEDNNAADETPADSNPASDLL